MPKTPNSPARKYPGVQKRKEREATNAYFAKLAIGLIAEDPEERSRAWAELNRLRPVQLVATEPPLAEDDTLDKTNPIYTIRPEFLTAEDAWRGTCELFVDAPDTPVPLDQPVSDVCDMMMFPLEMGMEWTSAFDELVLQ
jgi:hypothetical protein